MSEKFTDRARKVMALANQEACRCNHEYVDTGHILLGLLKEGTGVAATVLKNLGADLLKMRSKFEEIIKPGPDMVTLGRLLGRLPQTPQAKKALEYAVKEARSLNHNYVGTEHIFLGLLHQPEEGKLSTANEILREFKIKPKEVREEVMTLLGEKKKERPIKGKVLQLVGGLTKEMEEKINKFLGNKKERIKVVTFTTVFYRDKDS